jgi:hypothetical protein
VNNGWFWVPGPVVVRPIWAPALVGFVGGAGFHFSAGVGVGWFPLAPGEVYLPGYRVSRAYVNNVNITNTAVSVTQVRNVYDTVIVNRRAANNITYANQRGNYGVTVVSHDAFVNARPVAQNVMRVDAREIAAAPVSHVIAAEPIRSSVLGAGQPVRVKPPASVISRPVVAVRTPPPPPRPIEQRQAQAGGRLNQQAAVGGGLVRPMGTAQPAPMNPGMRPQPTPTPTENGFRPFTQPNGGNGGNNGNNQVRQLPQSQPRVLEEQGNPPPTENRNATQPQNRIVPPNPNYRPSQPQEQRSPQETHPLVRPTPPVQERTPQQEQQQEQKFNQWHEQRPATPPPAPKPAPRTPEPKPAATPAKK